MSMSSDEAPATVFDNKSHVSYGQALGDGWIWLARAYTSRLEERRGEGARTVEQERSCASR